MATVLIFGSTSEVGGELARIFAEKGFDLILAARNATRLQPLQSDLTIRYGRRIDLIEFDAEASAGHKTLYESLKTSPDIVIVLFGLLGNQATAEQNWRAAHQIINVNYVGAVSILNVVADDFKSRKKGTIVGVSSVAGERGRQSNFLYGSAKAGLTAYLSGLRNSLYAHNVHVVTVKPGFIRSRMTAGIRTPKLLTATPAQVASCIVAAVERRSNTVYSLGIWRLIMFVVRLIPEPIFKRLRL